MDVLLRRLKEIEAVLDTSSNRTVFKSLEILEGLIDGHIGKNLSVQKLIGFLEKTKLKYSEERDATDAEWRRNVVNAEMLRIEKLALNLAKLKALEKHYDVNVIEIDNEKYIAELQNLQLRYNYLLVRSINLMQNFLNLNENINNWIKYDKR